MLQADMGSAEEHTIGGFTTGSKTILQSSVRLTAEFENGGGKYNSVA